MSQYDIPGIGTANHPSLQRLALAWARVGENHGVLGEDDPDRIQEKFIKPALAMNELLVPGRPLMDAGTGVGVPGLVLALCRPAIPQHLVEPRTKSATLLRWVEQRISPITVRVHTCKLQSVPFHKLPRCQVVTRAALDWEQLQRMPGEWSPIIRWAGPSVNRPPDRAKWRADRLRWRNNQSTTVYWWGPEELFHVKQWSGWSVL